MTAYDALIFDVNDVLTYASYVRVYLQFMYISGAVLTLTECAT